LHYFKPNFYRQYPENKVDKFQNSAKNTETLLPDVTTLLNKITTSTSFAKSIKDAAQKGNTSFIKEFLKSEGITTSVDITYNPDHLLVLFYNKHGSITIIIPW
jgi:hypothetical protein